MVNNNERKKIEAEKLMTSEQIEGCDIAIHNVALKVATCDKDEEFVSNTQFQWLLHCVRSLIKRYLKMGQKNCLLKLQKLWIKNAYIITCNDFASQKMEFMKAVGWMIAVDLAKKAQKG